MSETGAENERLELRYVPLDDALKWEWGRNAKRHDYGLLAAAFNQYGFFDPPKFDPALNEGRGGFIYGNGRVRALAMLRHGSKPPPRGVRLLADGRWAVPVIFGVDAVSQATAEAAAIDHNNLTMSGGEYSALDMARMWGDGYAGLLGELAEQRTFALTVDGDDVDHLLMELANRSGGDEPASPPAGPAWHQLVYRPTFSRRNACRFLSLRGWPSGTRKRAIKEAKAAMARGDEPLLIAAVADLFIAITELLGRPEGFYLTATPPAPGRFDFAGELACHLAARLPFMYEPLFAARPPSDPSPPEFISPPPRKPCLLIEGYATDGRTLEACSAQLRPFGPVLALTWVLERAEATAPGVALTGEEAEEGNETDEPAH